MQGADGRAVQPQEAATLEYAIEDDTLRYRWRADVEGFDLPVRVRLDGDRYQTIEPVAGTWKTLTNVGEIDDGDFAVDPNFYVDAVEVDDAR